MANLRDILKARYEKFPLDEDAKKRARLISLAGDPTRLRILCFMFKYRNACVSDIAESLNMSIASISHHLQIMRDNGFFTTERMGNKICYTLTDSEFTKQLEKVVLDTKTKK